MRPRTRDQNSMIGAGSLPAASLRRRTSCRPCSRACTRFRSSLALAEEAEASSFVFALPARPGWADALANVTLSGPAGAATLDGDSDMPMAILRDPRSGQVRGFLRDPPLAIRAAAVAAGHAVGPGVDVLFSRGIPDGSAWRR